MSAVKSCDECRVSFANQIQWAFHIVNAHTTEVDDEMKAEEDVKEVILASEMELPDDQVTHTAVGPSTKETTVSPAPDARVDSAIMRSTPVEVKPQTDEKPADYYASRPHACEHCPDAFTSWYPLRSHCRSVHNDEIGANPALQYDLPFSDAYYAVRPFKCASCNRAYPSPSSLASHRWKRHQERTPSTPTFDDAYYVARPNRCPICPRAYTRTDALSIHQKVSHNVVTPRTEPRKNPSSKPSTKPRSTTRNVDGRRALKCDRCDVTFTQCGILETHLRREHNVVIDDGVRDAEYYRCRPNKCVDCALGFTRRTELVIHARSAHAAQLPMRRPPRFDDRYYRSRPFKCGRCDKAYAQMRTLGRHYVEAHQRNDGAAQTSDDELIVARPYICANFYDDCTAAYTTFEALTQHHSLIHADALEYNAVYYAVRTQRCEHCPKAFAEQRDLLKHMDSVHGIKRYVVRREKIERVKCDKCAKSFRDRPFLTKHYREAHRSHN